MKIKRFAAVAASMTLAMSVSALAESVTRTSDGWWTAWTPGYELADGATLEFTASQTSSATENWHSLVTVLTNTQTDGETIPGAEAYPGYFEYAALRTDNFGWGDYYNESTNESLWDWDNFKAMIADCTYTVSISRTGRVVTETINVTGANGVSGWQKYTVNTEGSDAPIYVFFTGENCSYTVNTPEAPAPAEPAVEPAPSETEGDLAPVAYLAAAAALAGAALMIGKKRAEA